MTHVAVESMARSMQQGMEAHPWLFSLLTDCMVLYGVCHDVTNKEYWVSCRVDTPEEFFLGICWMYLKSIGMVQHDVMGWETGEEASASSVPENVDEATESDDAHDGEASSMRDSRSDYEEGEEEERQRWQTIFLVDKHRKYGTSLPLTETTLSLRNAQT